MVKDKIANSSDAQLGALVIDRQMLTSVEDVQCLQMRVDFAADRRCHLIQSDVFVVSEVSSFMDVAGAIFRVGVFHAAFEW